MQNNDPARITKEQYEQVSLFHFSKLFLYIITVSFTMMINRSPGGESAGGGWSTSKSTHVSLVPA